MPRRDVAAALEDWRAAIRYMDRVIVLRERAARRSRTVTAASRVRLARLDSAARVREQEAEERYRAACRGVVDAFRRERPELWAAIETMNGTPGAPFRPPNERGPRASITRDPEGDR